MNINFDNKKLQKLDNHLSIKKLYNNIEFF